MRGTTRWTVNLTDVAVAFTLSDGRSVAVPQGPVNGWTFAPSGAPTTIVFFGSSCLELTDGTVTDVKLVYACGGPGIRLPPP